MNWDADMAITPDKKVDAAEKALSACPILPWRMGLGFSRPD